MKFIAMTFVVLCSVVAFNDAAVATVRFHNPSNPGKCTIDSNTIMSPGEKGKAPNNPCASVTCLEDSIVQFQTCPAVPPPKGCKLRDFVNTNRSFPECCERSYDCSKFI